MAWTPFSAPAPQRYDVEYWTQMMQQSDPWTGLCAGAATAPRPPLLYIGFEDPQNALLDDNWVAYPDLHLLISFMQFVVLPTGWHGLRHGGELGTPIGGDDPRPPHQLQGQVDGQPFERLYTIGLARLAILHGMAERNDCETGTLSGALADMTNWWNSHQPGDGFALRMKYFPTFAALNRSVQSALWDERLFEETLGMTAAQWNRLCEYAETNAFARHRLLDILNSRQFFL